MGKKGLMTISVALVALAGVVFAQAYREPEPGTRWEYGILWGRGLWSWHAPGAAVTNLSATEFAGAMNVRYYEEDVALEMTVLNRLAAQDWELVGVTQASKYVLRRRVDGVKRGS